MSRRKRGVRGFSLVEALISLSLTGLLSTLVVPEFQQFIVRSRIDGHLQMTQALMLKTRFESIKRGQPGVVLVDTASSSTLAFMDSNLNSAYDEGEALLGRLEATGGIQFAAPDSENVVEGFSVLGDEAWVSFLPDGSVQESGAFRIMDPRGNALELRVSPAATAKIRVRKWNSDLPLSEDGSHWYGDGEGGEPWTWN